MISMDEEALICDLAETYGIFDYRSLPVKTVATLSCGLRDTSRIKMKMSGVALSFDRLMLVNIYDKVSWIAWSRSKDAQDGGHPPESLLSKILNRDLESNELIFNSGEEFDIYWEKAIRGEE